MTLKPTFAPRTQETMNPQGRSGSAQYERYVRFNFKASFQFKAKKPEETYTMRQREKALSLSGEEVFANGYMSIGKCM